MGSWELFESNENDLNRQFDLKRYNLVYFLRQHGEIEDEPGIAKVELKNAAIELRVVRISPEKYGVEFKFPESLEDLDEVVQVVKGIKDCIKLSKLGDRDYKLIVLKNE